MNAEATAGAKTDWDNPKASDTSKSLKSEHEKEMAKREAMHGAELKE